jgi:putative ABC transport system ATP-binding protein
MTTTSVIALRSASRWFTTSVGRTLAVDDVSLEISAGEIVGLAGPSGAGKTTLINLLAGWERPDAGIVEQGFDHSAGWSTLAMVPQELGLIPELTAAQNVRLALRLSGASGRSVHELFAQLDLTGLEDRLPAELSVGEQQRTAVARSVICSPMLLVADEPTAHQDEQHADQVMAALVRVAHDGGAVLVATHDERLLGLVDRVLHLFDGRLVE